MKTGQNNNGYVSNAADYSPPSQSTLLLRNGSSNTSSDTTYYPNGQVPSVNSTLTRNSRSTTVDSRQDVGLPNVHGSFNSLQNSILSEYKSSNTFFKISQNNMENFIALSYVNVDYILMSFSFSIFFFLSPARFPILVRVFFSLHFG